MERDRQKNAAGIEDIDIKRKKIECYMACVDKGCWSNVMDGMKSIEQLHQEVKQILDI